MIQAHPQVIKNALETTPEVINVTEEGRLFITLVDEDPIIEAAISGDQLVLSGVAKINVYIEDTISARAGVNDRIEPIAWSRLPSMFTPLVEVK